MEEHTATWCTQVHMLLCSTASCYYVILHPLVKL